MNTNPNLVIGVICGSICVTAIVMTCILHGYDTNVALGGVAAISAICGYLVGRKVPST